MHWGSPNHCYNTLDNPTSDLLLIRFFQRFRATIQLHYSSITKCHVPLRTLLHDDLLLPNQPYLMLPTYWHKQHHQPESSFEDISVGSRAATPNLDAIQRSIASLQTPGLPSEYKYLLPPL